VIAIRGIDHVVLRVTDLKAMVRFYTAALGCRVERERPDLGLVHLRAGHSQIDLVDIGGELGRKGGAAPGREGRNMDHLCLRIEAFDVAAIRRQLAPFGVEPGEVKPRFGADGEGPSVYLTDPEGNTVELKGPPSPER
jgi:catechol 2,3-dioxygenase-like lactoylglutathione lyase family enzyme